MDEDLGGPVKEGVSSAWRQEMQLEIQPKNLGRSRVISLSSRPPVVQDFGCTAKTFNPKPWSLRLQAFPPSGSSGSRLKLLAPKAWGFAGPLFGAGAVDVRL